MAGGTFWRRTRGIAELHAVETAGETLPDTPGLGGIVRCREILCEQPQFFRA
jgi:hypothetical protein